MVFHWSLSDNKSHQVSRTLLSILAVLNNAIVWMVSTRPPTSKSSRPFNNPFVSVPKAPITTGIIVTFMFHSFFNSLARSRYLTFCSRRNFGLACNLIRRIISPNQDDLSYSIRTSFPGSRNWVNCQTHSLWLNNAVQCRGVQCSGGSSIATAAAWTHEGTYPIYGFLASIFF